MRFRPCRVSTAALPKPGDLIADVTYFGAVGASCRHPELAYEFLRLFLSEDAQWEVNRSRSTQGFQAGLIAAGWPVRAEGAAEYLWQNMEFQLGFYVGQDEGWESRAVPLQMYNGIFTDIRAFAAC